MKRDLRGIDEMGLNSIASMEAMSKKELIESANSRWRALHGHDFIHDSDWVRPTGPPMSEVEQHLREYVNVMSTEPDALIPLSKVYHDLKRILGDEE